MTVGILCESAHDFEVFSVLVQRLLEGKVDIEKFIPYAAESSIVGKLEAASVRFFKGYLNEPDVADFAVYFSDLDRSPDKKQQIIQWVNAHRETYPERIIVSAFASPHFESWFFEEGDCLHAVMPDLPADIPYPDCEPKERLRRIENKYADITKSSKEIHIELAQKVNLNSLKIRSQEFNAFANDLLTAVRATQNLS